MVSRRFAVLLVMVVVLVAVPTLILNTVYGQYEYPYSGGEPYVYEPKVYNNPKCNQCNPCITGGTGSKCRFTAGMPHCTQLIWCYCVVSANRFCLEAG